MGTPREWDPHGSCACPSVGQVCALTRRLSRATHDVLGCVTPDLTVLVASVVEEATQAAINASLIGGPVPIPDGMRAAALQRAMSFAAAGTLRA